MGRGLHALNTLSVARCYDRRARRERGPRRSVVEGSGRLAPVTFHVPRNVLLVIALTAALAVGVVATILLTGPGDEGPSDEEQVRETLAAYFEANSTGDYEQVCELFTPDGRQEAAEAHDPGSTDCVAAFEEEAESLGDSLEDANEIYRDAEIDSLRVRESSATAVIDFGGASESASAELLKTDGDWLMDNEP